MDAEPKGLRPARAEQQRTRVHQTYLKEQRVNRVTNVNFTPGARVPCQKGLEVLPAAILRILVPHYRSYRWWAASASCRAEVSEGGNDVENATNQRV